MDTQDLRILGALNNAPSFQWDARASVASIAKQLGMEPETVRLRIRRMEESGAIEGHEVVPNPSVLGLRLARFEVPGIAEEDKDDAIARLALIEGAHWFFDLFNGGLAMVGYSEGDRGLERTTELVAALTGKRTEAWDVTPPPSEVSLEATDWRLVHALRGDPDEPYAGLADAVGTSQRTVQRRLARLTQGRALIRMLVTDFQRMDGFLPVEVRVVLGDEAARGTIAKELLGREDLVFAHVHADLMLGSYGMANAADAGQFRARLARLDGVAEVRAHPIARRISIGAWLDGVVAERARKG